MSDYALISFITDRLQQPSMLDYADKNRIDAILEQYPFFVPARYLAIAYTHKFNRNNAESFSGIHQYSGNYLLFCDLLEETDPDRIIKPSFISSEENLEIIEQAEEPIVLSPMTIVKEEAIFLTNDAEQAVPAELFTAASTETEVNKIVHQEISNEIIPGTAKEQDDVEIKPVEEIFVSAENAIPESEILPGIIGGLRLVEEPLGEMTENPIPSDAEEETILITPIYAEDYFLHQGITTDDDLDIETEINEVRTTIEETEQSLMVMMSFTDWLLHYKKSAEQKKAEAEDKKALKMMWQKEKLAAAIEEENEEIPEGVFKMAMNSITREDDLASESLADLYTKQGKYDLAINMYKKLSLLSPEKNTYFAAKIEEILKEK